MLDAGRLQDGVALLDGVDALALVFELRPSVEHVDELEVALVDMPLLHLVLLLHNEPVARHACAALVG